jgi:lipase chaperone LimK
MNTEKTVETLVVKLQLDDTEFRKRMDALRDELTALSDSEKLFPEQGEKVANVLCELAKSGSDSEHLKATRTSLVAELLDLNRQTRNG